MAESLSETLVRLSDKDLQLFANHADMLTTAAAAAVRQEVARRLAEIRGGAR